MRQYLDIQKLITMKRLLLVFEKKQEPLRSFRAFSKSIVPEIAFLLLTEFQTTGYITLSNLIFNKGFIELKKIKQREISSMAIVGGQRHWTSSKQDKYFSLSKELYEIVEGEKNLTMEQLFKIKQMVGYSEFFDFSFSFVIEFNVKKMKQLKKELEDYIKSYMNGDVISERQRFYTYPIQKTAFERTIGSLSKVYGIKNLSLTTADLWNWIGISNSIARTEALEKTRFLETIFAMELEKLIKLVEIININTVRISLQTPLIIPELNDWNKDFYDMASSISYLEFVKKRNKNNAFSSKKSSKERELKWNGLSLDIESGWSSYNNMKHKFMTSKDHFKILKLLIEAGGSEVSYEKFFKLIAPVAKANQKAGKEYIRQKIRDIRKYFRINRNENREKDIFQETGNGFRLMNLTSENPNTVK